MIPNPTPPNTRPNSPEKRTVRSSRLSGKGFPQGVSDEEQTDPTERKHEQYQANQAPPFG